MHTNVAPSVTATLETELRAWRVRVLDTLLTVVIVAAAPLMAINGVHAVQMPAQWPSELSYLVLYLVIVGLRIFRQLGPRVRAWGLVLVGCVVGAQALAVGGLAGDGRVILLAVPMLALVLIGVRPGLIVAGVSMFVFAVCAVTAHVGWMAHWLLIPDNPLDLEAWVYEGIVVIMCLALLLALQTRLYTLLTNLVAERTQFSEAAHRSHLLYQTVTHLTSDFAYVVRVEPDGRAMSEWLPEGFTSITGYVLGDMVTTDDWINLVHPDDVPIFRRHMDALTSGQSSTSELRIRTKGGAVRWVRVYGRSVRDGVSGQAMRIYGAAKDITSHRQADEALEKRVAQLALLNDIGSKIAAVLDLDSVLERAVRLVREGFGYHHVALFLVDAERGDLVMKARSGDFAILFPRNHRIRLGQGMVGWVGYHAEEVLAKDVRAEPRYVNFFPEVIPTQSELSVPVKVGQEVVGVLDVQSPHLNAFDEDDVMALRTLADQVAVAIENARLYEAVRQELIERERAEEALRESEEMARAILNATTESVLLVDEWGTILALNQTAAQRLGKREDELVGLSPQDLSADSVVSSDVVKARGVCVRQVVRSGEPVRFEDERDGVLFNTNIYPIFDARGNVTRLAIFARDVTARKRAEQQALRAERLAAMGRLAASLAHEINNPLQAIRSNLELALDFDLKPEEQQPRLEIVRCEIQRLVKTSRRILDFSRIPDDTRYPVPITHLIQKTLALANKKLQLDDVQVTTDCPAELPPVFVSPGQIAQLLLNLTINAIEATGGGGHLYIAAHADGDMMVLEVTNDGPPIPEDHIERVFEPFFTTKLDGTGLGLTVCHNIVQQHGGTISVENLEDDQGVRFTVRLPVARFTRGRRQ